LAQACEVEACEGASPWNAWASALGGLGAVAGNGNSSTLTYNFGGGAAGLDYRIDPSLLLGFGAGYAAGNQWVDSFMGRGWSDTVSVTVYGSFAHPEFSPDPPRAPTVLGGGGSGGARGRSSEPPGRAFRLPPACRQRP